MNQLTIFENDGILVTDSRDVAKMVGKRHDHLMRDICGYIDVLIGAPNLGVSDFFIDSTYQSEQNKTMPCYLITKKGCDMVANKMTGEKGVLFTAAYVNGFHKMSEELSELKLPQNYIEALKALVSSEEEKQELLEENRKMLPKAEFYDAVADSKDGMTMSETSKMLGLKGYGRTNMFDLLREVGVLQQNNEPYQTQIDAGRFSVVMKSYEWRGKNYEYTQTLVTPKGIDYIRKLISSYSV